MKKYSIIFLILSAIIVQLNYVLGVGQNEINQVGQNGLNEIKSGVISANTLAKAMQSKSFPDVIQKTALVIPGVTTVVSYVGFILSLVGTSESPELLETKRLFNEMDARFDSVERDLQNIQKAINWAHVQSQFGNLEQNINTVFGLLKNIYTQPLSSRVAEKDYFMASFRNTCTNCVMNLYHGIMGTDCALTGDIFQIAMDAFKYDRKQTQNFMVGILQLLLRGIQSELAYRKLMYGDTNYKLHLHTWEQRVKDVTSRMQTVDGVVKAKYHDQAGKDIDGTAANQHTLSNDAFSKFLYDFLKKKYYWRDWLVVIYNPINGGGSHMNQQCDGFTKYRLHGRNIVVSSVDSMATSMDKAAASSIISSLPTSYYTKIGDHCGLNNQPCYARKIYNADEVYNGFPDSIKSYCSPYAADGVIDIHSNIHYQAPPERLFHTTTAGYKPYEVFLFG